MTAKLRRRRLAGSARLRVKAVACEGLGGLLDRFRQSGQGKAADSWIGTGPNDPVSPGQLGNALGPNIIKTLAERSGLSEEELLKQLSQVLPGVVDKLTPNGRLPTLADLAQ